MPLAHAGGVDEIVFLLLPAAVFFFVLQLRRKHLAERDKAERDKAAEERTEEPSDR